MAWDPGGPPTGRSRPSAVSRSSTQHEQIDGPHGHRHTGKYRHTNLQQQQSHPTYRAHSHVPQHSKQSQQSRRFRATAQSQKPQSQQQSLHSGPQQTQTGSLPHSQ